MLVTQGLMAYRTGEAVDVIDIVHNRATITCAYDLFTTLVAVAEEIALRCFGHLVETTGG